MDKHTRERMLRLAKLYHKAGMIDASWGYLLRWASRIYSLHP